MENASKALLLAGTVLIAIITISLFVLTINNISDYKSSSTELASATELAKFNEQFTQYVRDDVKGVELISLLNSVADYYTKKQKVERQVGEINYDKDITIYIDLTGFNEKHAARYLFNTAKYELKRENVTTGIMNIINTQRRNEEDYGRKELSTLASNEESLKKYYTPEKCKTDTNNDIERIKQEGKSMETVLGKKIIGKLKELEDILINDKDFKIIDTESEFANFKTSTFMCTSDQYYPNEEEGKGQVKSLSFEFVK